MFNPHLTLDYPFCVMIANIYNFGVFKIISNITAVAYYSFGFQSFHSYIHACREHLSTFSIPLNSYCGY